MWFLPTHDRPEKVREVLAACVATGMTTPGLLVVNGGERSAEYESIELPLNWRMVRRPVDEPIGDAYRWCFREYENLNWYGFLTDDLFPVTPGWDVRLIDKAGLRRIVSSNDGWQAPKRMHGAFVIGGDLMRGMGGMPPEGFQHQYIDDFLETAGRDLGVWDVEMDVLVEHRHPLKTGAEMDTVYKRNFSRQKDDHHRFARWERFEKQEFYKKLQPFAREGAIRVVDLNGLRVTFATPCYGGQINHLYVQALAQTIPLLMANGIGYNMITVPKESLIQRARNYIVSQFLEGDGTHLLFIDADMGWEPQAVLDLLACQKDLIGAAGRRKEEPISYCWNVEPGPLQRCPLTGVIKAKQIGCGFMLIKRETLERMISEYPDTKYHDVQSKRDYHSLFEVVRKDGYQWSEDYTFCDRFRAIGGDVWVHPMITLQHVGDHVYAGKLFDTLVRPAVAVGDVVKAA